MRTDRLSLPSATHGARHDAAQRWTDIGAIVLFALIVRLLLWNGPFGSDDVVYFARAVEIGHGVWSSADYNGSLRYGFNAPAGAFVALFGSGVFVANLWPLLCSLGEIALVYGVAEAMWGRRAAIAGALVLASVPLHIAVATRIHADPVVSLFLSLAFALFFFAERTRDRGLYFACGLAMGGVFWTKELAAVTLFAFFAFPLLQRRVDSRWGYVCLGFAVMMSLHLALMQLIAGDALHLVRVVAAATNKNFIQELQGRDSPWIYFGYLFFDLRHTGLAGLLALAASVALLRRARPDRPEPPQRRFVLVWWLSLLCVLSFFPVSLHPLRLAMKQSNYLTLFLAPTALLAGCWIASRSRKLAILILTLVVGLGLVLGALEQADYRVFTSNSKAAIAFARTVPDAIVVGSTNNSNLSAYEGPSGREPAARIRSFDEMTGGPSVRDTGGRRLYAVIDQQTLDWVPRGAKVVAPLGCWEPVQQLAPAELGLGNRLAGMAASAARRLPAHPGAGALQKLAEPKPAGVFLVRGGDLWCGGAPPAKVRNPSTIG